MRVMGIAVRAAAVACVAFSKAFVNAAIIAALLGSCAGGAQAQQSDRGIYLPLSLGNFGNSVASRDLQKLNREIAAAYDSGDCLRFEMLRSRLRDILNNPQHPFWQKDQKEQTSQGYRYIDPLFSTPIQPVRVSMEKSVEFWDGQDCKKKAKKEAAARISFGPEIDALLGLPPVQVPAAQNKFDVAVTGGFVLVSLPTRGFLGREGVVSGVQELNQVAPTRRASGSDFEAAFNYHFGIGGTQSFQIKIGHSQVSANETGGSYDPGPGQLLLIPGPNGGASGFSLGASPLNGVRNINYKNDISAWDVAFGYTGEVTRWRFGGGGTARVEGVVGVGARWGDYNETFSGEIPGFARNFGYSTNVNVNSARGIFGANLVLSSSDAAIPFEVPIQFKLGATISPTLLRALGTDSLDFTGFPTSSQHLSNNKTDVGYGVTAEVDIKPRSVPVIFDIKLGFERQPGFPVIERNGFSQSGLSFNSGDSFTILLGARYYGGRLN